MAIHPTALVHPKAELDTSVEVGPYCIIEENVRIAAGCRLWHGVYVTGWTSIDEGCRLHPGVIVGHAPQDTKYSGARTFCRVGRGTILREYVTVHRGTDPESETTIGDNCFLLAGSHVAHNCRVGNDATFVNDVLLGGHVQVFDRAFLGGGAAVHQFVRVGELAMVAGRARVYRDAPPFAIIDEAGRVAGLNRVGLRRANVPREHIDDIRNAYRILYAPGVPFKEAIDRLAGTVQTLAGERLLEFVRNAGRRGIAGRRRPDSQSPDPFDSAE